VSLKTRDQTTTATMLSKWLGISPQAVASNARLGVVHRAPKRGEYYLQKSIRSYCDHLRKVGTGREGDSTGRERTRLLEARAASAEAKSKKLRAGYLSTARVEQRWIDVRRRVLAILAGIPEEAARRLPNLTPHDIGQIRDEVDLAVAPLKEPKAKGE
jgi:phage terminase Nu1 subunit (DNA packaging protein)